MPKKLVVLAGPDEGRTFVLSSEALLLGRSRATGGHLIDPHVARVPHRPPLQSRRAPAEVSGLRTRSSRA